MELGLNSEVPGALQSVRRVCKDGPLVATCSGRMRLVKWVTAAGVRRVMYDPQVSVGCCSDLDTLHGTAGTILESLLVVGCDGPSYQRTEDC